MAVYREAPKCPDCGQEIEPINKDMGDTFVGDTFIQWDYKGHICPKIVPVERRGKYVNRSTYQKLAEENKKLLADIHILTAEGFATAEKIITLEKWRRKFKEESTFERELKEFLFGKKL